MNHSVVMSEAIFHELFGHLRREDGQEDLCFALWYPSKGTTRENAIIVEVILPEKGDREVHGNASFMPQYFERALSIAIRKNAGLAFLHSHPFPGWQGMSRPDIKAEETHAPATFGATGMPLVGLTTATDGSVSARFWMRIAPRQYQPQWCESVRVVGRNGLVVTYNDRLLPPPKNKEELKRTIAAWGENKQQNLARLRVGIVGLGSVGSAVAEAVARTGVQKITLIDFDKVEQHNLDRLQHATGDDIGKFKVDVVGDQLKHHATADSPQIIRLLHSASENEGYRALLDCDVIFSCVDRPLARHVLNHIAIAHLIPVIDGGIAVRTKNKKLVSADWRAHIVMPGNICMSCLAQYSLGDVALDREGLLDDPSYIPVTSLGLKNNQNVYIFSMHCASMLMLQFLSLVIDPPISHHGSQMYHFVNGTIDANQDQICDSDCPFLELIGRGDKSGFVFGEIYKMAEIMRNS